MPTVEKSIAVDVPVTVAYDQWTQFEEFPRFMEGVKDVRQLDDSHLRWVAEVGGQEESWEAEIVEQTPHERIAWRSVAGKENGGAVTFERLGDTRCRVGVHLAWEAEGLVESLAGFLGADGRKVEADLERFKELVETRGRSAAGGWHGEIRQGDVTRPDG